MCDIDWKSYSNRQLMKAGMTGNLGLERKDLLALCKELARRLKIIQDVADKF